MSVCPLSSVVSIMSPVAVVLFRPVNVVMEIIVLDFLGQKKKLNTFVIFSLPCERLFCFCHCVLCKCSVIGRATYFVAVFISATSYVACRSTA